MEKPNIKRVANLPAIRQGGEMIDDCSVYVPHGNIGAYCYRRPTSLIDGKYYWFLENDGVTPIRLFLSEIIDIDDYHERDLYKEAFPEDKNKGYKSVYKRGGSGR